MRSTSRLPSRVTVPRLRRLEPSTTLPLEQLHPPHLRLYSIASTLTTARSAKHPTAPCPARRGAESRIVVAADGSERLTEIGSYLQEHQRSEGTVVAEPGRAHELRYSWTIGK